MQNQMDDNMKDILDVVKKEKHDRERDVEHVKKRLSLQKNLREPRQKGKQR